jgi:hypothetical protein
LHVAATAKNHLSAELPQAASQAPKFGAAELANAASRSEAWACLASLVDRVADEDAAEAAAALMAEVAGGVSGHRQLREELAEVAELAKRGGPWWVEFDARVGKETREREAQVNGLARQIADVATRIDAARTPAAGLTSSLSSSPVSDATPSSLQTIQAAAPAPAVAAPAMAAPAPAVALAVLPAESTTPREEASIVSAGTAPPFGTASSAPVAPPRSPTFVPLLARVALPTTTEPKPKEVAISLAQPMGMVVNPDGTVAKVNPGGQADALGIKPGSTIVEAGGVQVASLDALKAAILDCKRRGEVECRLVVQPRRSALSAAIALKSAAGAFKRSSSRKISEASAENSDEKSEFTRKS